jgi:hypothetical protein
VLIRIFPDAISSNTFT